MTTRILKNAYDKQAACNLIMGMKPPITLNIKKGRDRSYQQNRLQRLWLNEAVEQLADETAEQKRGFIKLHYGVPILRNEEEDFREKYDRIIRPLPYEQKLELMMIPIDFPVTRLMKTGQMKRYLDDVYQHFLKQGVILTDPEGTL